MMNADVKAKWLDALRSGEYEQTDGVLARANSGDGSAEGFCCLGVLCDIAVKDGVIPAPIYTGSLENHELDIAESRDALRYGVRELDENGDEKNADAYSTTELPEAVRDWAGLTVGIPEVTVQADEGYYDEDSEGREVWVSDKVEKTDSLAELNDSGDYGFDTIADLIDNQL